MLASDRIKKWFAKFEKYTVIYKDGFFQMKHLANSPYTVVESFDKMPFCKHEREKKRLSCNTIFLDGELYYTKLDEGLWIFVADMHHKKNIEVTNIFDKTLPVDFHFINLHYDYTQIESRSMLMNGIVLADRTWWVYKAGHATRMCHFKNALEKNITIYFSNEWLHKQIAPGSHFTNSRLQRFFESARTYAIMQDNIADNDDFYQHFFTLLKQNSGDLKNKEIENLVIEFFREFINKYNSQAPDVEHFKLSDTDRKYIQKTEKYLKDNLLNSFPGIEEIAKRIGISPTKLKSDFKAVHNQSLYQYYRRHQMTLANRLLTEKATTVREVANLLGYENASKFAAVFKEQFGMLPSEVVKTQAEVKVEA